MNERTTSGSATIRSSWRSVETQLVPGWPTEYDSVAPLRTDITFIQPPAAIGRQLALARRLLPGSRTGGDSDVTAHASKRRRRCRIVADGRAGVDDEASSRVHDDGIQVQLLQFRDGDRQQADPADEFSNPLNR